MLHFVNCIQPNKPYLFEPRNKLFCYHLIPTNPGDWTFLQARFMQCNQGWKWFTWAVVWWPWGRCGLHGWWCGLWGRSDCIVVVWAVWVSCEWACGGYGAIGCMWSACGLCRWAMREVRLMVVVWVVWVSCEWACGYMVMVWAVWMGCAGELWLHGGGEGCVGELWVRCGCMVVVWVVWVSCEWACGCMVVVWVVWVSYEWAWLHGGGVGRVDELWKMNNGRGKERWV